jgi:hypothetical protein
VFVNELSIEFGKDIEKKGHRSRGMGAIASEKQLNGTTAGLQLLLHATALLLELKSCKIFRSMCLKEPYQLVLGSSLATAVTGLSESHFYDRITSQND